MVEFLEHLVSPLMVFLSFLAVLATYVLLVWAAGVQAGDILWLKDLALLMGGGVAGAAVPVAVKRRAAVGDEEG